MAQDSTAHRRVAGVLAPLDGRAYGTGGWTLVPGPAQCDWQDITFFALGLGDGEDEDALYVRDVDDELKGFLLGSYDGSTTLPDGARDTGFRDDGRR